MRFEVAIILIVCGTLLALAPPASDYLTDRQAAQVLLERPDFNRVTFASGRMSKEYSFGCWALGAAMIVVGICGGWQCGRTADDDRLASVID